MKEKNWRMIRDIDRSIRSDPISDSSDQIIAVAGDVVADVVVVAVAVFQLLLPQAGRSLVRIPVLVLLL